MASRDDSRPKKILNRVIDRINFCSHPVNKQWLSSVVEGGGREEKEKREIWVDMSASLFPLHLGLFIAEWDQPLRAYQLWYRCPSVLVARRPLFMFMISLPLSLFLHPSNH